MLIAGFLFVLQFKPVQTFFAQRAAHYLSSELKTRVEINGLYIKPFKSLVLEGLYIQDLQKDTLLYSAKFTVDIKDLSIKKRKILVNDIRLEGSQIYLKKYTDQTTNLTFLINYFNKGPKSKSKPYDVFFKKIVLDNIAFKYRNFGDTSKVNGINFENIGLSKLSATILDLETNKHIAKAQLNKLTFHEKSGFYLKNLSALATIDKNQMEFKNLSLETPKTKMGDYFLMKFGTFKDFDLFNSKVYMSAHFKNTRIYSRDLSYFATGLRKMNVDIELNGQATGRVNNIKARALSLKIGKTTYLKGDFDVKGLPLIDQTFVDLDLNQAFVNKQDLDYIIEKITGKRDKLVPPIVSKFGNVNFKGRFTGFTSDFIAFGEFKTKLGRIVSDVNMKIDPKGTPHYSGAVKVDDFDIGNLIDDTKLGRVSLEANVKGKGFNLAHLEEQAEGKIAYLDFNGYRYKNIQLDGNYQNKEFKGKLHINDKNLNLSFNGALDLNSKLPIFNFTTTIGKANLKELNLYKDSLTINADLKTNFSGNNLSNIQGNFNIHQVSLSNSRQTMVIDSISLKAAGIGNNRVLAFKSDVLDASIHGNYDLSTLPTYFLTVIKKYIPSLQTKITKPQKPQNFDLELKLKNFEPVRAFFAPTIRVPHGAILTGKFSSEKNLAVINAYAKFIQYKKIKIHDLVIDENTSPTQLDIFIASDRVDFTDSLFVKNINIANILRNDSLSLNVKLSDKNATNQLDLNGLIEFNTDANSKAKLSLLPSEVIINHEIWKIHDKVTFDLDPDKSKIRINNFGLARNTQLITVNGTISSDPNDELIIGFSKFQLTTLTPLTKGRGIYLTGELNGQTTLANLQNQPNIQSNIKIDSLTCNKLYVGDLYLETSLNHVSKLIALKAGISKQETKTVQVIGTYNLDKNDLNADVQIINNPVALLQPFLKHLVSNLSGAVSADLKVTGELTKPQINGTINLNEVDLTINYLKTHYRISNDLVVRNNVIHLSHFILRDQNNHKAIADEGTVDLNNLDNPVIHASLKTNQFMVLNTSLKDNTSYYGTAFGTGTFEFNGPVDNMSIRITARTDAGTTFNIPLNLSERISENNFITFAKKDSTHTSKQALNYNGLTLNFDLEVTDQAETNIYTSIGKLSGRGNSNLNLSINRFGDFSMFGDYFITQGKFRYNARNIIDKIFDISPGGTIRWTGDPANASIHLNAIYSARTNVKPLYLAAGRDPKDQRVVAEAVLYLTGDLQTPEMSFKLNFPNDSYINDDLQGYLSDISNTMSQAFSLIVQRSFIVLSAGNNLTNDPNNPTRASAGAATTKIATETAINRATDILANSLNLRYVDFSIRPQEDYSASLRLWNDRLIITGIYTDRSADVQNINAPTYYPNSPLAGDVRYLIKKDGSLAASISNKPPQRTTLTDPNSPSTQNINALGLTYNLEFDGFLDFKLIKMLIGNKRKEEHKKK
ncbi:MAG: translocation/assembly module TamB domain-containing protein [Sphingobacteriaceae bacterium]